MPGHDDPTLAMYNSIVTKDIRDQLRPEGAESAKEKVLERWPDAFFSSLRGIGIYNMPLSMAEVHNVEQVILGDDWSAAAQHPSVSSEGKQEGPQDGVPDVEHPVDELAQRVIDENPPTTMSAAYREVARRLYDTINPIGRAASVAPQPKELATTAYTLGREHTCNKCEHSNTPCEVAPQPQPETGRICPLCQGKECEYCEDGHYVDENDSTQAQPQGESALPPLKVRGDYYEAILAQPNIALR